MSIERRVAVLCLGLLAGLAPNVHAWRVNINGGADKADAAYAVAVDAAGDVIAAGSIVNASRNLFVMKLAAATGVELWRREIDGGEPFVISGEQAWAVVLDAAGDVLVGGSIHQAGTVGERFSVMKLTGATGEEVWRQELGTVFGVATAVATDAVGDVVAVGRLGGTTVDVHVAKLAAATGVVLWQADLDGTATDTLGPGRAVAVDGNGDVIVAGSIANLGMGGDWLVAKLSGVTGAELWRRDLDRNGNTDYANAVVVDSAGDVIATGYSHTGSNSEFAVHKLSGADGTDVWRVVPGFGEGFTLALDPARNVVAAGALRAPGTFDDDFAIVRLSSATGAELWRTTFGESNTVSFPRDFARAVAVRGDGTIAAAGVTNRPGSGDDFTLVTFDGATGSLLWRLDLDGAGVATTPAGDYATAVAVASSGDVVGVGAVDDQRKGPNFSVVHVSAGPEPGKQLVVTDRGDPSRRVVKFKNTDPTLVTAAIGGPNDPTIAGGALRLTNPGTAETATVPLPAGSWEARAGGAGVAWEYRDPARLAGPCQSVRIEPLRRISAKCRGAGIGFSLDEPMQGTLAIEIETGAMGYCARFGGTVSADRPGTFKGRNAPVPASCP